MEQSFIPGVDAALIDLTQKLYRSGNAKSMDEAKILAVQATIRQVIFTAGMALVLDDMLNKQEYDQIIDALLGGRRILWPLEQSDEPQPSSDQPDSLPTNQEQSQ